MALSKKIRRYNQLISRFSNWSSFLFFKAGSAPYFEFKLRSGLSVKVKRNMLPPFKESFFDNIYLKELPDSFSKLSAPVIVDIGANVGFFSLNMFSVFPKAKIFAFEPMPFNYEHLEAYKNTYPQFDWNIYNSAIAEHEDGFTLYSSTVDGFSTMASIDKSEGKGKKIEVQTQKLESLMHTESIEKIDLLKLDCEGSEYPILYNLPDEILNRVELMCIETHPSQTKGNSHKELISYLSSKSWSMKDTMNSDGTGYVWAWKG